ncbi:hypothetical protein EB822_00310 [Flavobacteriaceae bacterium PRS1]|nr:hypothetical protein EB822_00310 [Flavobacteriaceae bacterium PRS1]
MKKLLTIALILVFFPFAHTQDRDHGVKPKPKTQKTRTTTNTGVGVSIDLTSIFRSLKKNKNCNQVEMVFPRGGFKFKSNIDNPPLFRWKSSKPKLVAYYKVQLVLLNRKEKTTLFQGETDITQISWPKDVAWVATESGKHTYRWYVMAILKEGAKCKNTVESIKFTVTTTVPVVIDPQHDVTVDVDVIDLIEPKVTDTQLSENNKCTPILALENKGNIISEDQDIKFKLWLPSNFSVERKISIYKISDERNFFKNIDSPEKINLINPNPVSGNKIALEQAQRKYRKIGDWPLKIQTNKLKTYLLKIEAKSLKEGNYVAFIGSNSCVSKPIVFSIKSSAGCLSDISLTGDIECMAAGNNIYDVCITFSNTSSATDFAFNNALNFTSNGVTNVIEDLNGGIISNISFTPASAAVILANQSVKVCFTLATNQTSVNIMAFATCLDGMETTNHPNFANNITGNIDLPNCICDDCEEIELSFDDFNITPNESSGNQFNFNGYISANMPIYGLEFQIQSYSYKATPSACTEGVSSLEESGMFLMPGTTINGSASIQLFNETVSGDPNTNNNATKTIRYMSNSPLTGYPVNLIIGLPGPISGLDPSCCCLIEYTVCIKVRIFYENGNCKSCMFTKCFNFNNQ